MNKNITPQEAAKLLTKGMIEQGYIPEALHTYKSIDGSPLYHKVRLKHPAKGKAIRPFHRGEDGVYRLGEPPEYKDKLKPLFCLHLIQQYPKATLIMVEGESVAEKLNRFIIDQNQINDYVAVTSGGSTSAECTDWTPVAKRHCILWPDNDITGHKYMRDVEKKLLDLDCTVEMINAALLSLDEGEDFVDWLQKNPTTTLEEIVKLETHPKKCTMPLSTILDQIAKIISEHVICHSETADAAALWITMTWIVDYLDIAPLAIITAPDKRCGKTTMLTLLGKLVKAPQIAANISPAALFRTLDQLSPTLLIDETDTFINSDEQLRGILNCGHTRDTAYVIRLVGKDHTPTKFFVFGPKALAGIGNAADTLNDRAIILELRRKLPTEKIKRIRQRDKKEFEDLKAQLEAFAHEYEKLSSNIMPILPDKLNDRAQDNWEPLYIIAEIAGGSWPGRAMQASLKLNKDEEVSTSENIELLMDIKELLSDYNSDRISSKELLEKLLLDEEKAWATYERGKAVTLRQIAQLLKAFNISSKSIRFTDKTAKGYMVEWFKDSFDRYLS